MPFMTKQQIKDVGFASVGEDVYISINASFYGASRIHIGNHVRIDDFCVLSAGAGGINIGNYIHIAVYSSLIGAGKIVLHDYANISSRVSIYSSNDDYSGDFMTNPMVPIELTNVTHKPVTVGMHTIIGAGSIILPGVTTGVGVAIGALSLIKENCDPFSVYAGRPAKKIKSRNKKMLELQKNLIVKG
ncbi:Galactoside O-acetyltransferase [Enterobacteriaceae bacterium bta3-1]|nr:Galactoside O-acetyltransferase [Enterobacteriaceae bacterium bta3-1]